MTQIKKKIHKPVSSKQHIKGKRASAFEERLRLNSWKLLFYSLFKTTWLEDKVLDSKCAEELLFAWMWRSLQWTEILVMVPRDVMPSEMFCLLNCSFWKETGQVSAAAILQRNAHTQMHLDNLYDLSLLSTRMYM